MKGAAATGADAAAHAAASEDLGVDGVGNALQGGDEIVDRGLHALAPLLARLVAHQHVKARVVAHDRDVAPDHVVRARGGQRLGSPGGVGNAARLGEGGVGDGLEMPLPVEARGQHGGDGLFKIREPAGTVHFKRQHRVALHVGGQGLRRKNQHCTQHEGRTEYQMHYEISLKDSPVGPADFFDHTIDPPDSASRETRQRCAPTPLIVFFYNGIP